MRFKDVQKKVYEEAISKGWYDGTPRSSLEIHALIHSEISEATEAVRKGEPACWRTESGKPDGEAIELVDAVIRILDYFEHKGWDFEEALSLKMQYNKTRSYRHGGKAY